MFVFFSSRLGCLGSILVSVLLTVVLIAVLNSCRGRDADGAATERPPAGAEAVGPLVGSLVGPLVSPPGAPAT